MRHALEVRRTLSGEAQVKGGTTTHLQQPRLEVRVDEDVVAVELEAMLVVDDRFLHRQQRSGRAVRFGRHEEQEQEQEEVSKQAHPSSAKGGFEAKQAALKPTKTREKDRPQQTDLLKNYTRTAEAIKPNADCCDHKGDQQGVNKNTGEVNSI